MTVSELEVVYGACFTEEEFDQVFSRDEQISAAFDGESLSEENISAKLKAIDNRFQYVEIYYQTTERTIYVFGIHIDKMKDDEPFGAFKKTVENGLSSVFGKKITCNIFTVPNDWVS